MEVRSAGSAFEKRGARTQCGPIWRKTAHETSPDHAKESRQALEVLAAGLGRGVRKFRTTIATRKPVGPTAISSSLVLGLDGGKAVCSLTARVFRVPNLARQRPQIL